jgi:hypothetical protein
MQFGMCKYFFVMIVSVLMYTSATSQGCVAIRTVGGLNTMEHAGMMHMGMDSNHAMPALKKWDLNIAYRYFNSFRHFNGTVEQKQRIEEGTEVRNFNRTIDLSLVRTINDQWNIGVALPLIYNERSSKYEHISNLPSSPRFVTSSGGIGDARITAYKWLWAPKPGRKGNLMGGIGLKLPTGNYKAVDDFTYKLNATRVGPVDQSIQLGDGGLGVTLELSAFRQINNSWSLYGNAFYLINPRDNNGVSTARGGIPSEAAVKYTSHVMSVPDQYLIRAGSNWTRKALTLSLGARYECIPTFDLIGKNSGFRRPGTVIAAEPGGNYQFKKFNLYAYLPISIFRERNQSQPDILRTIDTKVFARGDAAFADYAINIGIGYKF